MRTILTFLFVTMLAMSCSSPLTTSLQSESQARTVAQRPDLIPTNLVIDWQSWRGIRFHFTLSNAGNAKFNSQFLDWKFRLLPQPTASPLYVSTTNSTSFPGPLAVGSSTIYGETALPGPPMPIPAPSPNPDRNFLTSDSSKYLSIELTPRATAPESNYSNNTVSVLLPEKLPDLTTYISVSGNTATKLTYNYEIRNIGLKPIPKSAIYLMLWISTDEDPTHRIGSNFDNHTVSGSDELLPGHRLIFNGTHTFPTGTLDPDRYVVAQAVTTLSESDSTDNTNVWRIGFHPAPTPDPDPLTPQK